MATIKTKNKLTWKPKNLDGTPILDSHGNQLTEQTDTLHVFCAFSSNPASPDGWNLAVSLAPARPDLNGDVRADLGQARCYTFTHSHSNSKLDKAARALLKACQDLVDDIEA